MYLDALYTFAVVMSPCFLPGEEDGLSQEEDIFEETLSYVPSLSPSCHHSHFPDTFHSVFVLIRVKDEKAGESDSRKMEDTYVINATCIWHFPNLSPVVLHISWLEVGLSEFLGCGVSACRLKHWMWDMQGHPFSLDTSGHGKSQ